MLFYLVRHTQSIANQNGQYEGWNDSELSEKSQKQALAIPDKLPDFFDKIYCSTLKRTRQTLEIILNNKPSTKCQVVYDPDLRESSAGTFENKNPETDFSDEDRALFQKILTEHDFKVEGGESINEFNARIAKCWNSIVQDVRVNNLDQILIVTHGGWIQFLLESVLMLETNTRIVNGAVITIKYSNGDFKRIL